MNNMNKWQFLIFWLRRHKWQRHTFTGHAPNAPIFISAHFVIFVQFECDSAGHRAWLAQLILFELLTRAQVCLSMTTQHKRWCLGYLLMRNGIWKLFTIGSDLMIRPSRELYLICILDLEFERKQNKKTVFSFVGEKIDHLCYSYIPRQNEVSKLRNHHSFGGYFYQINCKYFCNFSDSSLFVVLFARLELGQPSLKCRKRQ